MVAPMMVPLNNGSTAIVDADDYPLVSQFNWYEKPGPHTTWARKSGMRYKRGRRFPPTCMHNLLLLPVEGMEVDHINGNGLDNRRCNLRYCTKAQNQWNQRWRRSAPGYIGVEYRPATGHYIASAQHLGRWIHVGVFPTGEDAARARDRVVMKLRGEFAVLNFPQADGR